MVYVQLTRILGVAAVVGLMAPATLSAQGRPDFTGEWHYNDHIIAPERYAEGNRFRTPLAILIIKQTPTEITLEAKGFQQEQPPVTFRLDGRESVTSSKASTTRGTATWQGSSLVLAGTRAFPTAAGEQVTEFKEIYGFDNGILMVDRTETRAGKSLNDKFAFTKEPYRQAPMPANTSTNPGPDGSCPKDSLLFRGCALGKAKTYKPPRTATGEPDLVGYWQIAGGLTGTQPAQGIEAQPQQPLWGGGRSMVVDPPDGVIPFQPWAREDREWRMRGENAALDSLVNACLAGLPRIETYSASQWIRSKDQFVVLYEFHHHYRFIKMDGRPPLNANIGGLWQGSSRGHWEGDTLVVETSQYNGKQYVDMQFVTLSEVTKLVERYTLIDSDTMLWEATVSDPKLFTRPWTMVGALRRNGAPDYQLLESACVEDNREFSPEGVYRSLDFARIQREADERARARGAK